MSLSSQIPSPSDGLLPSKSSKLKLKVPPASKSVSPQKPLTTATHKIATSVRTVNHTNKVTKICANT